MDAIKKKKLIYSLWSLVYLALTIVIVVSSISLFNNLYYESVYVNGSSMSPTFDGRGESERFGSDYGIIDKDYGAKKNVKRFQIVTTYYPGDQKEVASYKIKRLYVKPGETFKFENNDLYIKRGDSWGEPLVMPFTRNGVDNVDTPQIIRNTEPMTLKDNEYFVVGDNWVGSLDSFSVGPISFDLLVGVVVKMEGKCTVQNGKVIEKQKTEDRYYLGVDY